MKDFFLHRFNSNNEHVSPSACSSQLQTRKKRKRKENSTEEEQQDVLMNNALQDNLVLSQSRLPFASLTNSTVTLRQTKRKRRT